MQTYKVHYTVDTVGGDCKRVDKNIDGWVELGVCLHTLADSGLSVYNVSIEITEGEHCARKETHGKIQ